MRARAATEEQSQGRVRARGMSCASCSPLGGNVSEQSSFSSPQTASVTHHDLRLRVDFARRVLVGSCTYTVVAQTAGAGEVVLDTNHLQLTALPEGAALDAERAPFGRALRVPLPAGLPAGGTHSFSVGFETTPEGGALQFLEPAQTAGKAHP